MTDQLATLMSELDEGVRRFGLAVADHLSRDPEPDPASGIVLVSRIMRLLDPEDMTDEEAAIALLESPEIMASFFQNADLLGTAAESAHRVARIVTLALEQAWEE